MCVPRTAGFAHVSLAEQAKILVAEAEDNLDLKVQNERWLRHVRLCEQDYPRRGVRARMGLLEDAGSAGDGFSSANGDIGAWERFTPCRPPRGRVGCGRGYFAMTRRLGDAEEDILQVQTNLPTHRLLGREEDALRLKRDVYSGLFKLHGKEHEHTLQANNYASSLGAYSSEAGTAAQNDARARRVLGESHDLTLKMRKTTRGALQE